MSVILPNWPPNGIQQNGTDLALQYVGWLQQHLTPLLEQAKDTLRKRYSSDAPITAHGDTTGELTKREFNSTAPFAVLGHVSALTRGIHPEQIGDVVSPDGSVEINPVWTPLT